jgi:SpoVK/Ycf46/Vps4 family AAA+-type ATPase
MARADLIVKLVEASQSGDDATLQRTVEALIAEERTKQHHVLAERLEEALHPNGDAASLVEEASSSPGPRPVQIISPRRQVGDLVLPDEVVKKCSELIEEQQRIDLLRSYSLEPRHTVLLTGPPGNGKTSLAEAIANALAVPLLKIRYEAIIGSYLGETAAELARAFSFARTRRCVLFFDEFDAIAKERGDEHETGEIKRVVSSLLMQIDELPSHVVVAAASNHPELLDRAAGRRFEVHLDLPKPTPKARAEWFARFLGTLETRKAPSPETLARKTAGASFSELEDLTLTVSRRLILDENASLKGALQRALESWKSLSRTDD